MTLSSLRRLAAAAILPAALSGQQAAADVLAVRPVAVQRQTAPPGGRYVLFGDISVDPARRVTFTASLSTGRVGVFRTRFGEIEALVMSGDDAPPDAGNAFLAPLEAASNTRGDLAFVAGLAFPPRDGLFLLRDGVLSTLALQGQPAPTGTGLLIDGFDQLSLLDNGEVYVVALLRSSLDGSEAGRAVLRHSAAAGLEPALAPGERYGGLRLVESVLQYDINPSGEIAALVTLGEAGFLQDEPAVEIVLKSAGVIRTLTGVNLQIGSGVDLVRSFAATFDQVVVDEAGTAGFFASTNLFPLGGYYANSTGRLFENARLISQGDPSPFSPGDRLTAFGAFGRSGTGMLAFHALSQIHPGGGIAVVRGGESFTAARRGDLRPDGMDVWQGFLRVVMNEQGAFAFTDFQGLANVGVFIGRFVPPSQVTLEALAALLAGAEIDRSLAGSFRARLRSLERAIASADRTRALRVIEMWRSDLAGRAGRSLGVELAERIDALLDDLLLALDAELPAGDEGPPVPPDRSR
ncbi:MAG TPA: hypothetical protein VJV23_16010 [Candidatus Polarisedimenticolia bacterium]|nr:hypothetical protein [Candidatus Polarisedimenticolia bacterium]